MTVSSTASKVTYAGNGATTAFPFAFMIPASGDLEVTLIDADGTETTLSGGQFDVTGLGVTSGGTVTYPPVATPGSPLAAGRSIRIARHTLLTQPLDLVSQGAWDAGQLETALDRITYQLQEIAAGGVTADGGTGGEGWSPILAVVVDGSRRAVQVIDWTGGTGTKPAVGLYVGETGLTADLASATDIRGPAGPSGSGAGDVLGPASNSDAYVPVWNGANSKILAGGRPIGIGTSDALIDRAAGDGRYRALSAAITGSEVLLALGYTPTSVVGSEGVVTAATLKSALSLDLADNKSSATIRSEITSANVTGALGFTPTSVTGLTGVLTASALKTGLSLVKADVGLGSVDNTADTAKPVSTAQQAALDGKEAYGAYNGISPQTASHTLVLADQGTVVEMNVASANNVTVPPNSSVAFPVNARIDLVQMGAGQTSVVAGAGVTIRSSGGKLKLTGQYSGACLYKRGTNEWVLIGDITT